MFTMLARPQKVVHKLYIKLPADAVSRRRWDVFSVLSSNPSLALILRAAVVANSIHISGMSTRCHHALCTAKSVHVQCGSYKECPFLAPDPCLDRRQISHEVPQGN